LLKYQLFISNIAIQAAYLHSGDTDLAKALDVLARLSEFVVPKLSRSTIDAESTAFIVEWTQPPHPLQQALDEQRHALEHDGSDTTHAVLSRTQRSGFGSAVSAVLCPRLMEVELNGAETCSTRRATMLVALPERVAK